MSLKKAQTFEKRTASVMDGSSPVEHLKTINNFPVFIGATTQPIGEDIFGDLTWDICTRTGCIQLRDLIDPRLIYSNYHSEALGGTWVEHHQQFVKFVNQYCGPQILEVGGSNGALAKSITSSHGNISRYDIVEPNPLIESSEKIKIINDFFSEDFSKKHKVTYDTIVHSHTLEHAYDPIDFIKATARLSREGSYQVFSVPNLEYYLKNKFSNTLNFEHTYMLTHQQTVSLLSRHGFNLVASKNFRNHSIFYVFQKQYRTSKISFQNDYTKFKNEFRNYIDHFQTEVETLNDQLLKCNVPVYLFGAHVFSQFLFSFGLKSSKISGILDNSQIKQKKRLYGTPHIIYDPNQIVKHENVCVILKVGQYYDEIKRQLLALNPNVIIWK
ncbi:methyltransferase domain-containing protein [Rhodobacterales bacterium FZCC0188]|nr:methyltransferase domain-containing protein [Rhodobacterales bacterium FZCC0188]